MREKEQESVRDASEKALLAPVAQPQYNMTEVSNKMMEYNESMLLYDCAIKIVRTKLDVVNAEFQVKVRRNLIHSISSRRKKTASIVRKLQKEQLDLTVQNMETHLHDIAGVRVICNYLDDVYELAQAITEQDDVELVRQKDYISNPKRNGYRSLHLILSVPVFLSGNQKKVEVEVQLRTIAMDYWASLEHQLKYKHEIDDPAAIAERLRICAETIARTDVEMLSIRRSIERNQSDGLPAVSAPEIIPEFDIPIYG